MSKLIELSGLGQSVWCDFISRKFINDGSLKKLIDLGLKGVTSNPTIFDKAISGSEDYDEDIRELLTNDIELNDIYEKIVIKDIVLAANLLSDVYVSTGGVDGYVSLEVNPLLATRTKDTIREAVRLHKILNRPNIMIKVPATEEGIPAIEFLIGQGINVNVTLIFSLTNYKKVAEAYIRGLEKFSARGGDLSKVASVASFFVSRVDSTVDKQLEEKGNSDLKGKIAVANSCIAFKMGQEIFSGPRWEKLTNQGSRVQRLLWASTGTKNPEYSKTLYVDELIGPDTVNTLPPETIEFFQQSGKAERTIDKNIFTAEEQINKLSSLGISIEQITEKLQSEGVKSFSQSFYSLMDNLQRKSDLIRLKSGRFFITAGKHREVFMQELNSLFVQSVAERIWKKDHSVWSDSPVEISNRLGWLDCFEITEEQLPSVNKFVEEIKSEGFTDLLLLGMGGSSLAPEVFGKTFTGHEAGLKIHILDSTDPDMVSRVRDTLNPLTTLYMVSTKSGGTVETISFMKYFYNYLHSNFGADFAKNHFVAITDPGSGLEDIAIKLGFRKIFLNDPEIGGRYSALSLFGIVPAALAGIDVARLLNEGRKAANNSIKSPYKVYSENRASVIGALIGACAKENSDKLTFILSESVKHLGVWFEQLIAESTGKNGVGILPVDGEDLLDVSKYLGDRVFINLYMRNEAHSNKNLEELIIKGYPVISIPLDDIYQIGGEIFSWEFSTAIASWVLNINPFDQPNVESAKVIARKMVSEYINNGKIVNNEYLTNTLNYSITGNYSNTIKSFIESLIRNPAVGNKKKYLSLQAYVPYDETFEELIRKIRGHIGRKYGIATTFGYGPRFLHSTGQLHKGDSGNGIFLQILSEYVKDTGIPETAVKSDSSISFGVLRNAQSLGDASALKENERTIETILLKGDYVESFRHFMKDIGIKNI